MWRKLASPMAGLSPAGSGIPATIDTYYPPTQENLNELTNTAFDYIMRHLNKDGKEKEIKGGKLIVVGYSYGGVLALHLAKRLRKAGVPIDLLITLDPAAGPKSQEINRTIPNNVKSNINVYQTSPNNTAGSYGGPNEGEDGSTKNIQNIRVSFNHEIVDDKYKQLVIDWVLDQLQHR